MSPSCGISQRSHTSSTARRVTAPQLASIAPLAKGGGGWILILSDVKTLLETGKSFDD